MKKVIGILMAALILGGCSSAPKVEITKESIPEVAKPSEVFENNNLKYQISEIQILDHIDFEPPTKGNKFAVVILASKNEASNKNGSIPDKEISMHPLKSNIYLTSGGKNYELDKENNSAYFVKNVKNLGNRRLKIGEKGEIAFVFQIPENYKIEDYIFVFDTTRAFTDQKLKSEIKLNQGMIRIIKSDVDVSGLNTDKRNALKNYVGINDILHFSKQSLKEYLEEQKFSKETVEWLPNEKWIDYKKEALLEAKDSSKYGLSVEKIKEHLKEKKFTDEEVKYAIENLDK